MIKLCERVEDRKVRGEVVGGKLPVARAVELRNGYQQPAIFNERRMKSISGV